MALLVKPSDEKRTPDRKPELPHRNIEVFLFHLSLSILSIHISIFHRLFLPILEVLLEGSVELKHLTERKLTVGQDHVAQKQTYKIRP